MKNMNKGQQLIPEKVPKGTELKEIVGYFNISIKITKREPRGQQLHNLRRDCYENKTIKESGIKTFPDNTKNISIDGQKAKGTKLWCKRNRI